MSLLTSRFVSAQSDISQICVSDSLCLVLSNGIVSIAVLFSTSSSRYSFTIHYAEHEAAILTMSCREPSLESSYTLHWSCQHSTQAYFVLYTLYAK